MFKRFFLFIGVIFFTVSILLSQSAEASAILHIKTGEQVFLTEKSQNSWTLKWSLTQKGEVLETQTGRNFNYKFTEGGDYVINVTLTEGTSLKSSTVKVYVGEKYLTPLPKDITTDTGLIIQSGGVDGGSLKIWSKDLQAVLQTLPPIRNDGKIHLKDDKELVTIMSAFSLWEIQEYRIDKNLYFDSNADGDPSNDIDNQNDISLLKGTAWTTEYQKSFGKTVLQLTIVGKNGQQQKVQTEIVFDTSSSVWSWEKSKEPVESILLTLPPVNPQDKKIYLSDEEGVVNFYAHDSKWNIREYRIDKNIYFDSDHDGDPANDIDNLNDPSFRTGKNFSTNFKKEWGKTVVELTVVDENGKGSRIQREIVFGTAPAIIPIDKNFTVDKQEIFKGDKVSFTVENPELGEIYQWDFDGDSKIDLETKDPNVSFDYPQSWYQLVTLQVIKPSGEIVQKSISIEVKNKGEPEFETNLPTVDFSYSASGNVVTFLNQSSVDPNLQNQDFISNWIFGDGELSLEKSPQHTYVVPGNYSVILEIIDSVGKKNLKNINIATEGYEVIGTTSGSIVLSGADLMTESGALTVSGSTLTKEADWGSLIWSILKFFLYTILILIGLVLLGIGGYLVYLKIKHPDFTFAELIEEEKQRIFGDMFGGGISKDEINQSSVLSDWSEKVAELESKSEQSSDVSEKNEDEFEGDTSVPAWLQQAKQTFSTSLGQSGSETSTEEEEDQAKDDSIETNPFEEADFSEKEIVPVSEDDFGLSEKETQDDDKIVLDTNKNLSVSDNQADSAEDVQVEAVDQADWAEVPSSFLWLENTPDEKDKTDAGIDLDKTNEWSETLDNQIEEKAETTTESETEQSWTETKLSLNETTKNEAEWSSAESLSQVESVPEKTKENLLTPVEVQLSEDLTPKNTEEQTTWNEEVKENNQMNQSIKKPKQNKFKGYRGKKEFRQGDNKPKKWADELSPKNKSGKVNSSNQDSQNIVLDKPDQDEPKVKVSNQDTQNTLNSQPNPTEFKEIPLENKTNEVDNEDIPDWLKP